MRTSTKRVPFGTTRREDANGFDEKTEKPATGTCDTYRTVCALRKFEHERRKVKVVMVIDPAVRFNCTFRQPSLSINEVAIGFMPPMLTDHHTYLPAHVPPSIRNSSKGILSRTSFGRWQEPHDHIRSCDGRFRQEKAIPARYRILRAPFPPDMSRVTHPSVASQ
jgi:hypothetical protein